MSGETMRINSIFESYNGEITREGQGTPCTFIRFQGCPLGCAWCDTKGAQDPKGGFLMSVNQIVFEAVHFNWENVTITGGEPLFQRDGFGKLVRQLKKVGFKVSVETSGKYDPGNSLINRVHCWVMDYKVKSSGSNPHMNLANYLGLRRTDIIKIPVLSPNDVVEAYDFASKVVERGFSGTIALSPVFNENGLANPGCMVAIEREFLKGKMDVRLSVQIHKILGIK